MIAMITGLLCSRIKCEDKRKMTLCIVNGFLIFAIAALRNKYVGYDSGQYARTFADVQNYTYAEIWSAHPTEGMFYIVCKLLGNISTAYSVLYTFISALFAASVSKFIYKYSKLPAMSYFILVTAGFFGFTMTGMRQTMAFSILLLGIGSLFDGKKLKFLITVMLAFAFHNTSIVLVLLLFIPMKKHSKLGAFILGTYILAAILLFNQSIFLFVCSFFDKYSQYAVGGADQGFPMMAIMYLAILIVCYFGIREPDFKSCCILFPGICAEIFVMTQPNMFRIAMYFELICIVLLPNTISKMKYKTFAAGACYAVLLILFYVFAYYDNGIIPYYFYWQTP